MAISTGDAAMDKVLTTLHMGDNVVWQVDRIEDYISLSEQFAQQALKDGRKLIYVRFAVHPPVLKPRRGISIRELDAGKGFEHFSTAVHRIITEEGRGAFYVFDSLSELLSEWSNDLMVGNFFKITCPFLFQMDTIAYFSLLRNRHSFKTIARVRDTTQVLVDIYHDRAKEYVHPIKVWDRYAPTMFLPHLREGDKLVPIAASAEAARLFSSVFSKGSDNPERKLDRWDRVFLEAESLLTEENAEAERRRSQLLRQLVGLLISREARMQELAGRYLALEDLLDIHKRMIGTGSLGGKAAGMLLARKILARECPDLARESLEAHDSFYVGSDVFYSYLVENDLWKDRMRQRTDEGYFTAARTLKDRILKGRFPEEMREEFRKMMEYFGQSPMIVRSSSLLEDAYGNAFAGKYESVFLPDRGSPEERYGKFIDAVRKIYSSTMDEEALIYRRKRGLDRTDEQMALLVQRVSGAQRNNYFFPDAAGVGISYNTYVWDKDIKPESGMLRVVTGLGTRAVDRVEGDYPRIVALSDPLKKPHAGMIDTRRFSQHEADLIDVELGTLSAVPVRTLFSKGLFPFPELIASKDHQAMAELEEQGRSEELWVVTFDGLVSKEGFVDMMRKTLSALEAAYGRPVEIEFTVNLDRDGVPVVNILQCRPMARKQITSRGGSEKRVSKGEHVILRSRGNFLGGSVSLGIDRIIYVDPARYCALEGLSARYDIARLVGALNRQVDRSKVALMLLGPGRWGTSTPQLGVPVTFSEINNVKALGEIAFASGGVMPELSFGTHFFHDLIESDIFYLALFPDEEDVYMDREFFKGPGTGFKDVPEEFMKYGDIVKVFDLKEKGRLLSDVGRQEAVCSIMRKSA